MRAICRNASNVIKTKTFKLTALLAFLLMVTVVSVLLGTASAQAEDGAAAPDKSDKSNFSSQKVQEPVFGGQIYIREAGKEHSESVVLLHGLGDLASDTWSELIPRLARTYHVLAFDLPGFGRSDKKNTLYSPTRYAAVTRWLVDQYVDRPFHLIGHSLGAAVALRFAGDQPEDLQKLVLVDAAGILHRAAITKSMLTPTGLEEKMPHIPKQSLEAIDQLLGALIENLERLPFDSDILLNNEFLRSTILGGDPATIAALALVSEDFSAALYQTRARSLILWGAHDHVTPMRTARVLETGLTHGQLKIIAEAGHVPMLEQPHRFNEAILEFLKENNPPSETVTPTHDSPARIAGEQDFTLTGRYPSIEIKNSRGVIIKDVVTDSIVLDGSTVTLQNVRVIGPDNGLSIHNSVVEGSGLRVEADQALIIEKSRCDLAGADLVARQGGITMDDESTLLFSVSRLQIPGRSLYLHGHWTKDLNPQPESGVVVEALKN